MFSTTRKAQFRCLAAVMLFVWVVAQVACFLHCHYPGGGSSMISVQKKCCATQTAGADRSNEDGPASGCLTFKQVIRASHIAVLPAPELSLIIFAAVVLQPETHLSRANLDTPPVPEFSPPPLQALLKSGHLSLPPPSLA